MKGDVKVILKTMEAINRYCKSSHQQKTFYILQRKGFSISQIVMFYEQMMGFPIGWTELEPAETQ